MKNRIKLNESTLRQIIGESIRKVLNESDIYTREDWRRDREINPRLGQIVADDVIEVLAGTVPPKTWAHSIFQFGERQNANGYMTFRHTKDGWIYIGIREVIM
ncbi:MAG: hypothetical protein ACI3ZP_07855 [Candidatus Cryptobacteroides sp.]